MSGPAMSTPINNLQPIQTPPKPEEVEEINNVLSQMERESSSPRITPVNIPVNLNKQQQYAPPHQGPPHQGPPPNYFRRQPPPQPAINYDVLKKVAIIAVIAFVVLNPLVFSKLLEFVPEAYKTFVTSGSALIRILTLIITLYVAVIYVKIL